MDKLIATEWRQTPTGNEARICGTWYSVNGTPETGVQDIRFAVTEKINIETERRQVEDNGWVKAGPYYSASFMHPPPKGIRGCPLGRSQTSMAAAIRDLADRTNNESGTDFRVVQFVIVRHNGQPTER